jgi:hypothetical protein
VIHPDTRLAHISEVIGDGVVATAPIPAGTITWIRDAFDQRLSPRSTAPLPDRYQALLEHYAYIDRRGDWVLCWDHARFVNHSCEPTCLSPGALPLGLIRGAPEGLEIEIAVRDIAVGEQLTDDYGCLNLEREILCACGSPGCRGVIRNGDFEANADRWDHLLSAVFPQMRAVQQPLLDWLVPGADLSSTGVPDARLPSVLEHLYPVGRAS